MELLRALELQSTIEPLMAVNLVTLITFILRSTVLAAQCLCVMEGTSLNSFCRT